jgi:ribose 5-phosphate isomerase B
MRKKIPIGSDHAGFELKSKVIEYLKSMDLEVDDKGCYSSERADYPDFGHAVAMAVIDQGGPGILMCGSGNGISMAANKHKGVRAALCWNPEIAELARQHNDANILVLPARYISDKDCFACIDKFLNTGFEGGRHQQRVEKIDLGI